MNGDRDNITVIGKEHGRPRAVKKESDVFGTSFTGIGFTFISTLLRFGECYIGGWKF